MGALLALVASACWGVADYAGGTLSKRVRPLAVVGTAQLLVLPVTLLVVLGSGALGDPSGWQPWAVLVGVVATLAISSFYAALASGTMGVVAPVAATGVVVPVVLGLVQGERPSALQLVGILVAVVGVVLASGPELRAVEEHNARGGARSLVLALVAGAGFGCNMWAAARGAQYSAGMTLLGSRVVEILVVGTLGLVARTTGGITRRVLPAVAGVGLLEISATGSYAVASRHGLLSVVAVCASAYPVVTLLLARVRDGERLRRVQEVGVAATLVGVAAIAAGA